MPDIWLDFIYGLRSMPALVTVAGFLVDNPPHWGGFLLGKH